MSYKYFISIYNIQYRPRLLVRFLDFVSGLLSLLIDINNNILEQDNYSLRALHDIVLS